MTSSSNTTTTSTISQPYTPPPVVLKRLEKTTPDYLSAFNQFCQESEKKTAPTIPTPAPVNRLFTKGPKSALEVDTSKAQTFIPQPTTSTSTAVPLQIAPEIEDLVMKQIEADMKRAQTSKIQYSRPPVILNPTVPVKTYEKISKLVEQPNNFKRLYAQIKTKKIEPVPKPTSQRPVIVSEAITMSRATVETATVSVQSTVRPMPRQILTVDHRNMNSEVPQYYAKTTALIENGRVHVVADTLKPQKGISTYTAWIGSNV